MGQKCSQLQQYCHCSSTRAAFSPAKFKSPNTWPRFSHLIGFCLGAKNPLLCSGQNTLILLTPFDAASACKLYAARRINPGFRRGKSAATAGDGSTNSLTDALVPRSKTSN